MSKKTLFIFIFILHVLSLFGDSIIRPNREYYGQTIWDLPSYAEDQIDIGLWALIIAKEHDPQVDIIHYLQELENLASAVKQMARSTKEDMAVVAVTSIIIYDAGPWNNYSPFSYDLDDPLGKKKTTKFLSTYLDTKKGNCVSMPTLFLAVVECVNSKVPFKGVFAPRHIFCRLRDRQTGKVVNIEATNGKPARNEWIMRGWGNSYEKAISTGLYMKDLTKKEYLSELIGTLVSIEKGKGNLEKALKYSELILEMSPRSISGLIGKGATLHQILYEKVQKAEKEGRTSVSKKEHEEALQLSEEGKRYCQIAIDLGWKPNTDEDERIYLEMIQSLHDKSTK